MTLLPEGLPVDATWLRAQGYTANLLRKYEAAGHLEQPAHRVYARPRGALIWQHVVVALQTLLTRNLVVGGRSALELQGFAHYLRQDKPTILLYGPNPPPTWLKTLKANAGFAYRNDARIFTRALASTEPHALAPVAGEMQPRSDGVTATPWGPWKWPLMISSPERAILEVLDEVPSREDFHQVDMLMEGLTTLSPMRLQELLIDTHNVKVKRLFFFFADRHHHAWLKRIDRKAIDLGSGRRMIAKGGRFDATYLITVPRELDAVQ